MSADIDNFVWPVDFSCTIVMERLVLPNFYNVKVGVEPNSDDQRNIAIGFKKIRYFVDNYLQNSVFICRDNEIAFAFEELDTNVVILPVEPFDYFVGSILYQKFITLTEQFFDITQITIDSNIGDSVQYTIRHPVDCGLDLSGDHWWNLDSADTGSGNTRTWSELNLENSPRFEPRIIKGGLSEN